MCCDRDMIIMMLQGYGVSGILFQGYDVSEIGCYRDRMLQGYAVTGV